MTLLLLWWTAVATAACSTPTTMADVVVGLNAVEAAYLDVERQRFVRATKGSRKDMACMGTAVTAQVAGRFFVHEGLLAAGEGDLDQARVNFAGARWANSQQALALVAAGSPLHELFSAQSLRRPKMAKMARSEGATLLCNGAPCTERPVNWPVLVQVLDAESRVHHTVMLQPGQDLPVYKVAD
jgi:hypothetical protein